MPRFFFHTADGSVERDTNGTELPTISAARKAAVRYAGDVMRDQPEIIWQGSDFRVEVTDQDDILLFTVTTFASDAPAAAALA